MTGNRNWAVRICCPPRTVVWPAVQVIFWLRWLWCPWIFLPMNIECRIIESRDMQVNASLSPPPAWKMDLCLCKHEEKLLYVYDKYSLIWFAHKYSNSQSNGHKTYPVPQITPFPYVLDCAPCLTSDTVTAHHIVYACTYKWIQNIYALSTLS